MKFYLDPRAGHLASSRKRMPPDAVVIEDAAVSKIPFSLTLVHYNEGDLLGHVLALCTLSPIFAVVSYVSVCVALGFPLKLVFMFVGQLGNVVVNVVLKHMVRMPRPADKEHLVYFGKYGMPSNHSQFMAFLAVFALMENQKQLGKFRYPRALSFALLVGSLLVGWSRVYLEYHTLDQVIVGWLVGASVAVAWHLVWTQGLGCYLEALFGKGSESSNEMNKSKMT